MILLFIHTWYIHDADLNELVQESWDWDADTKTRTQGILASVRNFEFAVSLVTLKNVLEPLRGITAKLQKRDLDIYEAFCNIDSAIDDVTSNRLNIDTRYPIWYQEMLRISKSAGGEETLPRIAAKQLHRANHPANTAIDFYRLSLAIPFIDEVLAELKNRFSEDTKVSIKGLLQLVPAKIVSIEQQDLKSIIQNLNMYHEDLPRYEGLYVKLEIWKDKWARCKEYVPSTLIQSLVNCDQDTFPNLNRLFSIGCNKLRSREIVFCFSKIEKLSSLQYG